MGAVRDFIKDNFHRQKYSCVDAAHIDFSNVLLTLRTSVPPYLCTSVPIPNLHGTMHCLSYGKLELYQRKNCKVRSSQSMI